MVGAATPSAERELSGPSVATRGDVPPVAASSVGTPANAEASIAPTTRADGLSITSSGEGHIPVTAREGGPPTLSLEKSGLRPFFPLAGTFAYRISYCNVGTRDIQSLTILDHLPSSQVLIDARGDGLKATVRPEADGTLIQFLRREALCPGESGASYVLVRLAGGEQ